MRPDLQVELFRGNVETRLRKLDDGVVDATLLALAGLKRLGLQQVATALLPLDDFPPAVGQGAVGIEARADDQRTRDLIAKIAHRDTFIALQPNARFSRRSTAPAARRLRAMRPSTARPCISAA